MLWIEAIINISAFAGFIGLAIVGQKMNTTIDELHTFSQDRRHTARPPDDLKVGWRPD